MVTASVLGPEFRVNSYILHSQLKPSVATDASGNFVVVWESVGQEPNFSVFGQRFAEIVPAELMRFDVE